MERLPEIALHRFGLGGRAGERAGITDPIAWLKRQIRPQPIPAAFTRFATANAIIDQSPKERGWARRDPEAHRAYITENRREAARGVNAIMSHRATTDAPFHERLVRFWSNHFSISQQSKAKVIPFAFDYERSAIRPHVTGNFYDMLLATARHPAMSLYLDNAASIGPNSDAGRNGGKGLNENYAREVMELHTLGVGDAYTQKDIIELAKILTGWGVRSNQVSGHDAFDFFQRRHEPGGKVFLGRTYDDGEQAGKDALRSLTEHRATSVYVTKKFAAHFCGVDESGLAKSLADVFYETKGDLGVLAEAVVDREECWSRRLSKARSPIDYVTATFRAAGEAGAFDDNVMDDLRKLGEIPFAAASPQGWPDDVGSWFGPDQIIDRIAWSKGLTRFVTLDVNPADLGGDIMGTLLSESTRRAVAQAPSPQEGFAMLISSPEAMRR